MTTHHDHAHEGLAADLPHLLSRRRMLGLGGAGLAAALLAGCGDDSPGAQGAPASPATPAATPVATADSPGGEIPAETAGPFPGDGSNGPDALTAAGAVRRDIRSSFGSGSGTAEGVPLTIRLTIVQLEDGVSTPIEGASVYLWHADREGRYSMYSSGVTDENYLRGVQVADAKGVLEFQSIFPSCYQGRWPHIHFEVYPDLKTATSAGDKLRTTQLALPEDACRTVYATTGYEQSVSNLSRVSLSSDNVFSDGVSLQMAKVTGSVAAGYTASLTVPV
jgi:protocatechuate 3,4-dioxygenase beta subunit